MSDTIELTPFQQAVASMVLDRPAPGKHAARSAMAHIERAWTIRKIDPEMAAFRAITGEEESATAIFHALKHRKYARSEALNPWLHEQKAAVIPFLDALALAFERFKELDLRPTLEVETNAKHNRLVLRLTIRTSDGHERWAYPEPPLNFSSNLNGEHDDFSDAVTSLATKRGAASIAKLIEQRANYRNRILYASQGGVPKIVDPTEGPLLRRRDHIFRNLMIFLLIDQYSERQSFVQQALDAFLGMMRVVSHREHAT